MPGCASSSFRRRVLVILVGVRAPAFLARQRGSSRDRRDIEQVAQFPGVQQVGVEDLALIPAAHMLVAFLQFVSLVHRLVHAFIGAEDPDLIFHHFFHLDGDIPGIFFPITAQQPVQLRFG